jgi:hypothetical protein
MEFRSVPCAGSRIVLFAHPGHGVRGWGCICFGLKRRVFRYCIAYPLGTGVSVLDCTHLRPTPLLLLAATRSRARYLSVAPDVPARHNAPAAAECAPAVSRWS